MDEKDARVTPAPLGSHFETLLQHDIDLIRAKLLEMLALDERALASALQAFLDHNCQLAYSVILRDQEIDALDTLLDQMCLEFIVRHQPAAGHLRFVYAASKIVNLLERVGDYAESIARQVVLISSTPLEIPLDKFNELAQLALPMLHDSMRAFIDKNPDLARQTIAIEPRVNAVRDSLTSDLIRWREQGRVPIEALPPLITVARRLERISDQATNISEFALYFSTGEYLRHLPHEGYRVLFVDQANACLSRIAEAVASKLNAPRFTFESAGLAAAPVETQTARFLSEKGIDSALRPSRTVQDVPHLSQVQVIVTLCPEACQKPPDKPSKFVRLDWTVPDPSQAQGDAEQVRTKQERAWAALTTHIADLVQAILGNGERVQ